MKVSVIVPVFNTEDFLEECLLTLVGQTLKDIEIILTVDESSSDSSLDIARKYELDHPGKVKVVLHPKGLPGDSRNYGLEVAQGEYIGFIDSDDKAADIMYEALYQRAAETKADIVCCDTEYCYGTGVNKIQTIKAPSGMSAVDNPSILKAATCYVWNKIFKKDLIDRYCFRFPAGRWYEDSAVVYNMMLAANKIECVHIPLYEYKVRRAGGTANLVDNRVFDVLLSAKDIVAFFQKQGLFHGNMIETAYHLCRDHINARFNFLPNSDDSALKAKFINEAFDFFDEYFPNWISYHKPEDPEENALGYAKLHRDFALKYFCDSKIQAQYAALNKLHKKSRNEKYINCLDTPLEETSILYEAYEGTGMNCNPYALFLTALKDQRLKNYSHVWSISSWQLIAQLEKKWKNYPNVSFVLRGSENYFKALSRCKYLINNHSFPPYFSKKEGQVLITSWHGITVKTIGFDFPTGKLESWNQTRIYLQTDWFLAANDFMKNNLATAYKMQDIFHGKVLVEGYPRNDFLVNSDRAQIFNQLSEHGIQADSGKKIILYAPTWKGEKFSSPSIDLERLDAEIESLKSNIDLDQYQVLIKPHQVVYRHLSEHERKCGKYIPPMVETNELLSVVDILISDYSSIFVDFMCTKKPVLFYLPDLESYSDYRGIYFKPEELPGPTTNRIEEIASYINDIEAVKEEYADKYQMFYDLMFKGIEVGKSSERIIDCIFGGNTQNYRVEELKGKKKKLLIYPGNLRNDTVKNRVRQFLDAIDHSLFDITMLADYHLHPKVSQFLMKLPHRIRFLSTGIAAPKTKAESKALSALEKGKAIGKETKQTLEKMFYREYRRRFGDVEFDATIDLDPENVFQFHLLSQARKAVQIIWPADCKRSKNIFVQMKKRFSGPLCFMRYFVTGPDFHKPVKYPYDVIPVEMEDFIKGEILRSQNELKPVSIGQEVLFQTSSNLMNRNTLSMQMIPLDRPDHFKFVSFSHLVNGGFNDNVLHAFKLLTNQYENIFLYIVAGGTRFHQLQKLAEELGISQMVEFVNNSNVTMRNYFAQKCDCIIEVPADKEYLSLQTVRLAQVFQKQILMLKAQDDIFAPTEDHYLEMGQNVTQVRAGMISLYGAMKDVFLKQDKTGQPFGEDVLNHAINQKLYDLILHPVKPSPKPEKPFAIRALSKAKRMLLKSKRVIKSIINS
ncbi:CDP-glycerol glycerophosphotransferase family protein [Massiliimalia timonensis]|uniref:CDP-glycerol glycerophosphotransferase family protein n=1 Tax=Massiliimalia timonensis TaxID=1987501 RepID=UPI00189D5265|nr:CDP-glycerol glycerophosphotransferase family protein [Massiliimalia timonensis]